MNSKNTRGYMSNVDELVEKTPLELVLRHYGLSVPDAQAREYRMTCVFNEACSESKYGNLSVQLDAAKRIYCHSCKTAGNILTLLHGLEKHQPPAGGKLRGSEFKVAVQRLREINGETAESSESAKASSSERLTSKQTLPKSSGNSSAATDNSQVKPTLVVNTPLHRHEKEAARELANLNEDLVKDIAQMSPEAAAFVRQREHWLTPELMQKWGCGWIPGNGRSLFRKNYFVYTHRNTRGDIVSYSGRDLNFKKKWEAWLKAGKPEGKKPNKHRYVAGFKRGAELFGGFASRLDEPQLRESLQQNGLVVVEGMNDVIRLEELGICAVGLCSNRATDQQIEMLTKFAKQVANNHILLFPDSDEEGQTGFKDLLWHLAQSDLQVTLVKRFQEVGQPEELVGW